MSGLRAGTLMPPSDVQDLDYGLVATGADASTISQQRRSAQQCVPPRRGPRRPRHHLLPGAIDVAARLDHLVTRTSA